MFPMTKPRIFFFVLVCLKVFIPKFMKNDMKIHGLVMGNIIFVKKSQENSCKKLS